MTVREMIAALQAMPQDAHLMLQEGTRMYELIIYSRIVPMERGHYRGLKDGDQDFTGCWKPDGSVERDASNLIRIEVAQASLIGV